jgi:transcriptional regulator with XRE-family HTH domain
VRRKLKQTQMEQLLDIKPSTWSNYENGFSEPSIEGLVKISRFFGISLDELLLQDLASLDEIAAGKTSRRHKQYQANETLRRWEEQPPAIGYIVNELKKLRLDVNNIKRNQ